MTAIPHMDSGRPLVSVSAGFGNEWLQEIQRALLTQFPNIGNSAVSATAVQLSALGDYDPGEGTVEERLDDLEGILVEANLPSEAFDFKNVWWTQYATDTKDQFKRYISGAPRSSWKNAPFTWGDQIPSGLESEVVVCLVEKYRSQSNSWAVDNILAWTANPDAGIVQLMRAYYGTPAGTQLINQNWHRSATSTISTGTSTGGSSEVIWSAVCDEVSRECP
jgi:hypothetical protein